MKQVFKSILNIRKNEFVANFKWSEKAVRAKDVVQKRNFLQLPLVAALVDLLHLCGLMIYLQKGWGASPFKHLNTSVT